MVGCGEIWWDQRAAAATMVGRLLVVCRGLRRGRWLALRPRGAKSRYEWTRLRLHVKVTDWDARVTRRIISGSK